MQKGLRRDKASKEHDACRLVQTLSEQFLADSIPLVVQHLPVRIVNESGLEVRPVRRIITGWQIPVAVEGRQLSKHMSREWWHD
jgi:hypothetical protein